MPHFQIVLVDGTVLGARHIGRPDWPPGSVIYTARMSRTCASCASSTPGTIDPEWHFAVLVVEPE
jgi:hypothetical protein